MANVDLLIHSAVIVNEGASVPVGWVAVKGKTIADMGAGDPPASVDAAEVVDAAGAMLVPGAIDAHVHFRDPGLTHKADMLTESRAAIAGGVTSFIDMPNTRPSTVSLDAFEAKMERAAAVSAANYGFYLGATNDNIDQLLAADYTRVAGVKLFLGSSTGNMLVDSLSAVRRIFSEVPALIAVHAESEEVIRANRGRVTALCGPDPAVGQHPVIRDARACLEATASAVALARETGARLHVLHVSTAAELEFFASGPVAGKRITAETCPQYLVFDDSDYAALGTRIKCNPAIKSVADRDALRRAVASGRIDTVATDHAPHLLPEKQGGALKAVSGMPMIQFSLPLMMTLAGRGLFEFTDVVRLMCHNPATLFGIAGRGFLRPGCSADMVLLERRSSEVADSDVLSRCGWTPLAGMKLDYRVASTWLNGRRVFDGSSVDCSARGTALRFAPGAEPTPP